MKSLLAGLLLTAGFTVQASNVELVVERIDNGGAVPGETFRVYAVLESPEHTLHAIFGENEDALNIQTSGNFFQHPLGNFSTTDVNPNVIAMDPTLAFDSWVTLGAENASGNNLWTIGIDYDSFEAGAGFGTSNGAWFLVPTDENTKPLNGNMVLLMQLTTTGVASGSINIQGWDEDGMAWQARNLTFETSNAHTFGCTSSLANNYNANATYDDGSCTYGLAEADGNSTGVTEVKEDKANGVVVFPNPIWDGQFNLQFENKVELSGENMILEIFDAQGKRVMAQEVGAGNLVGGNRLVVSHDLAAGTYTVSARTSKMNTSTQIVVTR